MALTATLTISAASPTPSKTLKAEEPPQQTANEIKIEKIKSDRSTVIATDLQPMASPAGEWVKVSTGIWFEGPMAGVFSDVDEGQWEVDVYENATTKGWYRIYPYTADTQLGQIRGEADTQYPLDICAVDPSKVYVESWKPYNMIEFRSIVLEAGFNGSNYGTLSDGVITLESGCLAYQHKNKPGWDSCRNGFKLILNASTFKDYSIKFEAPLCASEADQYVQFAIGADVAVAKLMYLDGLYPMNDENASIVALEGNDITSLANRKISLSMFGPNTLYSLLYVTLDADGAIHEKGVKYVFIVENDDDNWEDVGQAVYTEAIISELFSDIDSQPLTCTVQKHKTTSDYFRLVNPYKNMPKINPISCNSHNHYLYINASDPDHVFIEPSVLGLNIPGFGDAAAMSWGYTYYDRGDIEQGETDGVWGRLDKTAGTVTIPAGKIRLLLTDFNSGSFLTLQAGNDLIVQFPENAFSGIDELNADSDSNAPVEYYNLQGIKVTNPAPGQIYLKRQGSKVSKEYIK